MANMGKNYRFFKPKQYLNEYYSYVGIENKALLDFHIKAYSYIFNHIEQAKMLELGGGPTIYQLLAAAKYPLTIVFSDYLHKNLNEVRLWLENSTKKHSWDKFTSYVLKCEGKDSTPSNIEERENLIRQKIAALLHCNARKQNPLGKAHKQYFNILSVNFVPESISESLTEWETLTNNIITLLRPKGYFIMSAIIGAQYYKVGNHQFVATPITIANVKSYLKKKSMKVLMEQTVEAEHKEEQGYSGLYMILTQRD